MLRTHLGKVFFVAALAVAVPTPSFAGISIGIGVSVNIGPPAFPVYTQPPCLVAGTLWTPGYWGWGPAGYYWVPGTWVAPPAVGLLWTPGYWGQRGNQYAWHAGYWGPAVGFYGGLNYGYGYFGRGYVGGGWAGNAFRYNTAVSNVNTTIVRNVYINKTVVNNYYNNSTVNRVSYNGGPGGIAASPTGQERAAEQARRIGLDPVQQQHVALAAQNRNLLAAVNGGHPAQPVVQHPYSALNRPHDFAPVQADDRRRATAAGLKRGVLGNASTANRAAATTERAPTPAFGEQRETAPSSAWDRFNSQRDTPQSTAHVPSADGFNAALRRRNVGGDTPGVHEPSYAQAVHEASYAQTVHQPSYAQAAHGHTFSQTAHTPNYARSGNLGGYSQRTLPQTYARSAHPHGDMQRAPQGSPHPGHHAAHEPMGKERRT